jgi:hypothetical protein
MRFESCFYRVLNTITSRIKHDYIAFYTRLHRVLKHDYIAYENEFFKRENVAK